MSEQTTEVVSISTDTVRLLIGMSGAAIVRLGELDKMLVGKTDFRVFYDNSMLRWLKRAIYWMR